MGIGIVSNWFKRIFGGDKKVDEFQLPLPNMITKTDLEAMYHHANVLSPMAHEAQVMAYRVRDNRRDYEVVAKHTGIPWQDIGVMHMRECGCDMDKSLADGSPLHSMSFIQEATETMLDRLQYVAAPHTLGDRLYLIESHNGFSYRGHGIFSPYLWSGTQFYTKGKFPRDHYFDPNVVDAQIGCVAVLKVLEDLLKEI